MTSIADSSVNIQTTSESNVSTPSWFGEVVLISRYLQKHHVLSKINEQVHFARKRFGRYEVIDFLAILFGYAISGERTLETFYKRLQPFAVPFMALFERDRLPSRSALSRFLAALCEAPVEALRTLFLDDLLDRPPTPDKQTGGLTDRSGNTWVVFDIDGTREAARQRALPQGDDLPPASRRLDDVCAAFLHGPQARASGSYPHNHQPSPQLSLARQFWKQRQWTVSRGTAKSARCPHSLPRGSSASPGARWCGWMDSMAWEPCLRIWRASPMFPAAKSTVCWITRWFGRVCTSLPISSSSAPKARPCAASTTAHRYRVKGRRGDLCRLWEL